MGFGNDNKKQIVKAPNLNAFEEMAKNYELPSEKENPSEITEKSIEATKENKPIINENKNIQENIEKIEEQPAIPDTKKTEKKAASKKAKQPTAYYKNFYNLRIDLPKQSEPLIELAAKVYGSKKDYIMKLIRDDMKLHADEYRKQIENQDDDNWDF